MLPELVSPLHGTMIIVHLGFKPPFMEALRETTVRELLRPLFHTSSLCWFHNKSFDFRINRLSLVVEIIILLYVDLIAKTIFDKKISPDLRVIFVI